MAQVPDAAAVAALLELGGGQLVPAGGTPLSAADIAEGCLSSAAQASGDSLQCEFLLDLYFKLRVKSAWSLARPVANFAFQV